jgi:NAD(P)-dependent dehydrogenase (short-subunit alcohol dehydrogenase family)
MATEIESLASQNLFDIRGRNALITGGTSGIGLMMAKGLIINGVEILFLTGHDEAQMVQESNELHSFAKEHNYKCKVYGYPRKQRFRRLIEIAGGFPRGQAY